MLYFVSVIACIILAIAVVAAMRAPSPSVDFHIPPVADRKSLLAAISALAADSRNADERGNGLNFRKLEKTLAAAYRIIARKAASGEQINEYEHILYENYYKIVEALTCARKSGDLSLLPHLGGVPRVYSLCSAVVKFSGGTVLEDAFLGCVEAFNYDCPLTFAEVEALPSVLCFALCEYIAAVSVRYIVSENRKTGGKNDAAKERVNLDRLNSAAYVTALCATGSSRFVGSVKKLCRENGFDAEKRIGGYYAANNRYAMAASSAVGTMFAMKSWLTDEFVMSLAPTNRVLSASPSCGYIESTLATRRHYLSRVAAIAKRKSRSEVSVAAAAYARAATDKRDITFCLLKPPRGKFAMLAVIFMKLLLAAAIAVGVWFFMPGLKTVTTIVSLPIAVVVSDLIISKLLTAATEPRPLPRVAAEFIPDSVKTCITCTRLISSVAEVKDAVFMLETVAAANPGKRFSYVLLVDLPPSKTPKSPSDDGIIELLKSEYSRLNNDKFNILIRNRSFLKEKNLYQGWERKRGALCDFNGLILRSEAAPFRLILGGSYAAKYVVAIDSDTLLNCADELTAIMEHPYNRAVTVAGLSVNSDSSSSEKTPFAMLFSGASGLDSYSRGFELNSDLFGSGNYTGKGIYRVAEFDAAVGNAFRDNRILSHDFIEGAYSGAKNCDETALDSTPSSFAGWLRRRLRWLRGDWQLLPWLLPIVSSRSGKLCKNPISPMDKWHILINMLAPLGEACTLALVVASSITGRCETLIAAFLPSLVRVAFLLPLLFSSPREFSKALACEAFFVCSLPIVALSGLAAIAVTIVRLVIKRGLLEWNVFAHSRGGDGAVVFVAFVFGVGLCALNAAFGGLIVVYVLGAAFVLFGPLQAYLSEQKKNREIPSTYKSYLSLIAAKTWNYFFEGCTPENNYLPPDNYCEDGDRGFCNRTSPTNIGMALVSAYSAKELNVIDERKACEFCEAIIDTIQKLERCNGHLYNWYDIKSLKPLSPRYVSSVDSGNLVCALLLCRAFVSPSAVEKIDEIIAAADFGFLYDEKRGLLRIGWNETEKRFDGYYDLAASEASMTYLAAIGLGKIPRSSWQNLQRKLVSYSGKTLYSWSGGAFEYLLAPAFFKYSRGTLYHVAAKNAFRAQVRYARELKSEYYGISESQYYAFEDNGDYRYRAFGVPGVALGEYYGGRVVAPYAAALSLGYAGEFGERQIAAFYDNGLIGKFGLYEAICDGRIVKSFMAHHDGMIMLGICNYLTHGAAIEAMRSLPAVRAAEMLLTQPMPNVKAERKFTVKPLQNRTEEPRVIENALLYPEICMFGSHGYNAVIDSNGNGFSTLGNYDISRKNDNNGFRVTIETERGAFSATRGGVCRFGCGEAEYSSSSHGLSVSTAAKPLASTSGELRVVRVKNRSDEAVRVKVCAAVEPVLTSRESDISHREYSNMFVKTALHSGNRAVTAERIKTGACAALVSSEEKSTEYVSSRANFYGRRKTVEFGDVLDPILAARTSISLKPGEEREVAFALVAAFSAPDLERKLSVIESKEFFVRERSSKTCGQPDREACRIAARILSCTGSYTDASAAGRVNTRYPLITSVVESERDVSALETMFFRFKTIYNYGIKFNLAVIYREDYGYYAEVFNTVEAAVERSGIRTAVPSDCVFKTVNRTMMPGEAEALLRNSTDINRDNPRRKTPLSVIKSPYPSVKMNAPKLELMFARGGFTTDGSYFIDVSDAPTPKPWSNVLCNPSFGTLVTESCGGFTYYGNSRENKLTDFSNDAVLDSPSELVLLGDKGNVWSIASSPIKKNCAYFVTHSFGFTRYECGYNGIKASLTEFVGETSVKYYAVELVNAEAEARKIDVAFAASIVLGDFREYAAPSLHGKKEDNSLIFVNANSGESCAVTCDIPLSSYSFNRASLLGDSGNYAYVGGLETLPGADAVCSATLELSGYGKAEVTFCLSAGGAEPHPELKREILENARKKYGSLSAVSITSGLPEIEYLYKWLPYQTLCSRFYARTGFYQVSGAYGFRDQLQDSLALLYVNPELTRAHILNAAAHQFEKGDVQHWWHPVCSGVRTHFTDDRLFLPLAVAEYVEFTQDRRILTERAPFLRDVPIESVQKSVYSSPGFADGTATVEEHCLRAIFSTELNESGFALMKGGDWNDGMDEVGASGKGISVFTTMLLYYACKKMLPLVTDKSVKDRLTDLMQETQEAVELAWDGDRYIRAVTDDGTVLGSKDSDECKIDILVQSFAVISGIAPVKRTIVALDTAFRELVNEQNGIVMLLAPPIKNTPGVGYIADYPAGIRENGGQYTHAAVWFAVALFKSGEYERAAKVLKLLNPIEKTKTEDGVSKYGNEPYVISADVYSGEHAGEGGWSWYTGAAAWLYKCLTEQYLGIKITGDLLTLSPCLPSDERGVTIRIKRGDCDITVDVDNTESEGDWRLSVDGVTYNSDSLRLLPSLSGKRIVLSRRK